MADPKRISITTRSGKVFVTGAETDEISITGGKGTTNDEGVLEIRRAGDSDDIEVTCPSGTDVTIGTTSGNVETHGVLGSVRILTVSGKIHVASAARVEIRTKSGKVDVRACEGDCRVVTTSSKVHIGTAGNCAVAAVSGVVLLEHVAGAEVKTVSGKVLLGTSGAGDVSVKTVSGKVEIRVPSEVRPATHLKSVSGKVQCDCEAGQDGNIAVKSFERRDPVVVRLMEAGSTTTGAIVFTDIVGFTQLTDERGDDIALALLERQEKIVRAALPDAARVVKELGDGLLLWFDDPCAAIDTCLRLQREFETMADDDPPLWVRIGMHFGTPRRRGDDIVGRDVNLAARIVDLAGPGEVLCSEAVPTVIGDRANFEYEPLGPVFVRGIADPVPILRILG